MSRPWLAPLVLLCSCCSDESPGLPSGTLLIELQDGWLEMMYFSVSETGEVQSLADGCDERWVPFSERELARKALSSTWADRLAGGARESPLGGLPPACREAVEAMGARGEWLLNDSHDVAVGLDSIGKVEIMLRVGEPWSRVSLPAGEDERLQEPLRFRPGHTEVALGVTTRQERLGRTVGVRLFDWMSGTVIAEWRAHPDAVPIVDMAFSADGMKLAVLRLAFREAHGLWILDDFLREMGHGRELSDWTLEIHDLATGAVQRSEVRSGHLDERGELLWVR